MGTQKKIYQLDSHASIADTDVLPISAASSGDGEKVTIAQIKSELSAPVDSVNGKTGVVVLDTGDISEATDKNYVTDAQKTVIGNTSGTNTGDQDLSGYATKANVLELDNTTAFTPDADYEPATKKYVDDNVGSGDMTKAVYDPNTVEGDAFDMDNMVEGSTNLILTSTERTKLNNTSGTNTGDQDLTGYMDKATYDPNTVDGDAFDPANFPLSGLLHSTATDVDTYISLMDETQFTNGFDLRTPASHPDYTFDDTTRTATVSVKSGSSNFYFRCNGKKFTKTSDQTVTIPDTTDTYYIYFDNSGVLQYMALGSLDLAILYEYAIVGLLYWNATQGYSLAGIQNELHGVRMSSATHVYNHMTMGARYESGMDINGVTGGSSTDFTTIDGGKFWDEDIEHTLASASSAPFVYRLGTGYERTKTAATTKLAYIESGNTYASWNEDTGTEGKLTEGTSSTDFFITFIAAAPTGYLKFIGQNAYSTKSAARDAVGTELRNLNTNGLPNPEIVFLYALIMKRTGVVQTLDDGSDYLDLRFTKGVGGNSTSSGTDATSVSVDTTNFDNNLSSADDTVQKALDTLDNIDIVTPDGTQTLTNKTLTNPKINVGSDATGDIYYRDASGNFIRLGVGTNGQVLTLSSGLPVWAPPTGGGSGTVTVLYDGYIAGEQVVQTIKERPAGQAFTLSKLKISLGTLPAGADFKVDLEQNGTSVLSATLDISTSETATNSLYTVTTGDSGKATVSTTSISADDRLTLKITQIGSSTPGNDFSRQIIAS